MNTPQQPGSKTNFEFTRITLTITGTAAWSQEYEILRTKDGGVDASYYEGGWKFNKSEKRSNCRTGHGSWGQSYYNGMVKKLTDLDVISWAGYNGSNPDVLDGSSFSFEAVLTNGKTVYAHGTNAYPKNYRAVRECLDEAVYGPKEY